MRPAQLHVDAGDRLNRLVEIDLCPARAAQLAGANKGEGEWLTASPGIQRVPIPMKPLGVTG